MRTNDSNRFGISTGVRPKLLPFLKRVVSLGRCVLFKIFVVFPNVQARCRSPTDRSFNTFKCSPLCVHTLTGSLQIAVQQCMRKLSVQHFWSIAFVQSHLHSADHPTDAPVNETGSRECTRPLHAGNRMRMRVSRIGRSRLQT